ncbi:MAG TPA: serine hydrolase domain-containing protein [Asticcacaulis sp.]|nr:serine hydrolase domain-containing protein [Asticcacaulis sp.]
MTETADKTRVMTRRAAFALVLTGLAGSAIHSRMPLLPAAKPAAKPKPVALNAPKFDWPSLTALGQTMVDRKLTPGLSLSVMHDGELFYSKGFGIANLDTGAAVTPQTGFRIASITKQFTAAAILLLAEDGKLAVTDPLSKFLPEFPRAGDVTLRQLMSHTAGLSDYINGQNHDLLVTAQRTDYTSDEVIRIIQNRTPLYRAAPGATWLYSNSGFALLGIIVERVSGLAFADFCAQRLFAPAGMAATAIDRTCTSANGCSGYRPDYRAPHGFDTNVPVSPSFIGGAGAIRSTTEDLVLWHKALLDGKVLKPQSLNAMLTPVLLKSGAPAMERRGEEPLEYGYGMGLGTVNNLRLMSHGGRVNGFTGHLRSLPDQKLTVAILYNCDGSGAGGFMPIQKKLRTEATRLGLSALGLA